MTAVVGFLLFVAGFVVRDYLHEREARRSLSGKDRTQKGKATPEGAVWREVRTEWTGIVPKPEDTLQQLMDAYMATCLLEECGLKGQVDV